MENFRKYNKRYNRKFQKTQRSSIKLYKEKLLFLMIYIKIKMIKIIYPIMYNYLEKY